MINVDLLERVMTHIKDNPDNHNQHFWGKQTDCGTTACFAGWTCLLSGAKLVDGLLAMNGEYISPMAEAQELLGISPADAVKMFLYTDTREGLELEVKDLINHGRLQKPAWDYDQEGAL